MNIAEMERRRDISGLLKAIEHPDQAIRLAGVCALLRLDAASALVLLGKSVIDLLAQALQEPDSQVRREAASALRRIGDFCASGPLKDAQARGWIREAVLYVEDNAENRLLVKAVLTSWGFTVFEAKDGVRGLQLASEISPDLILLDLDLPELSGYQVVRRLKEDEKTAHIPVVAITANVMKGDREKALAAGCDDYIPKPIDVDLLPQQIDGFIRARRKEASQAIAQR